MTIKEAQARIDALRKADLITREEAAVLEKEIRRTGAYGNKWSWQKQKERRAFL